METIAPPRPLFHDSSVYEVLKVILELIQACSTVGDWFFFFGFVVIFPTMCHMRQTEPPQSLNADLSCCAAAVIWEVTAPSFGGMRYCFTKDVVHLITFTSKTFMLVLQVCYCAFKSLFIYIKRGQKKSETASEKTWKYFEHILN